MQKKYLIWELDDSYDSSRVHLNSGCDGFACWLWKYPSSSRHFLLPRPWLKVAISVSPSTLSTWRNQLAPPVHVGVSTGAFFIMGLVEYGIFGAMQSIEWNGSWKRVISVFECFDVFVSDDVGSWKHMETLETCWTYSGFEEWMDCWILVIHLLLHHLSCLKGKEICLCCNCFSWFMVCIVFVGCRSRIFFSLFLVLLLLYCFSCCSSLSSLSTIFPVAVFVLVAVSPGLWTNPAKLPAATCVQQMFTVPIRIIYI